MSDNNDNQKIRLYPTKRIGENNDERTKKPNPNKQNDQRHQSNDQNYQKSFNRNLGSQSFFVFDIETIPCIETAKKLLSLDQNTTEDEVVQKLKEYHLEITQGQNDFFRQPFHKVVCVSFIAGQFVTGKDGKERYTIKHLKTGGRNNETEEEIIRGIFEYLAKHNSRLISFNGRGFDLSVLQYRAMKYGIEAGWIYEGGVHNYNHRFATEKHFDLLDNFSNFGASARVKMSEIAALLSVPCKQNGDGSEVYEMFKAGKIEDICNYCETDVLATYVMYLKFQRHAGKITQANYQGAINELILKFKDGEDVLHHQKDFIKSLEDAGEKFIADSI